MDKQVDDSNGTGTSLDRLVPLAAAQEQLGVSRSQIYRLLEDGEIPKPVKIGRRCYFSQRELQGWIEARLESRSVGGAQ